MKKKRKRGSVRVEAEYVTVWDGGETVITSRCIVNTAKRKITKMYRRRQIESPYSSSEVDDAVECLDNEYIIFSDGTTHPIVDIDDYDPDKDDGTVYVRY